MKLFQDAILEGGVRPDGTAGAQEEVNRIGVETGSKLVDDLIGGRALIAGLDSRQVRSAHRHELRQLALTHGALTAELAARAPESECAAA